MAVLELSTGSVEVIIWQGTRASHTQVWLPHPTTSEFVSYPTPLFSLKGGLGSHLGLRLHQSIMRLSIRQQEALEWQEIRLVAGRLANMSTILFTPLDGIGINPAQAAGEP